MTRVDRELLWTVLRTYGVNGELMKAVRSLYDALCHCGYLTSLWTTL